MTVGELLTLLAAIDPDSEIRVGDVIECGPYSHTSVGGVWRIDAGIVLCANPDDDWVNENADEALPLLWPLS